MTLSGVSVTAMVGSSTLRLGWPCLVGGWSVRLTPVLCVQVPSQGVQSIAHCTGSPNGTVLAWVHRTTDPVLLGMRVPSQGVHCGWLIRSVLWGRVRTTGARLTG